MDDIKQLIRGCELINCVTNELADDVSYVFCIRKCSDKYLLYYRLNYGPIDKKHDYQHKYQREGVIAIPPNEDVDLILSKMKSEIERQHESFVREFFKKNRELMRQINELQKKLSEAHLKELEEFSRHISEFDLVNFLKEKLKIKAQSVIDRIDEPLNK